MNIMEGELMSRIKSVKIDECAQQWIRGAQRQPSALTRQVLAYKEMKRTVNTIPPKAQVQPLKTHVPSPVLNSSS